MIINLDRILSDSQFNIRGEINMPGIIELARGIKQIGLIQPIVVQPYNKVPNKDYRIIAGHRRFAALLYNEEKETDAVIKKDLSDQDAFVFNLLENVEREDLNILQEANGIKRLAEMGLSNEKIGTLLNKSSNWVNVRVNLLSMPEAVQQDAAAGWLTQPQIMSLAAIKSPYMQCEAVKKIKEARERGDKLAAEDALPKKKSKPNVAKHRSMSEILEAINHIIDTNGDSDIVTRTLAWAGGQITELDWQRDLIRYYRTQGVEYAPPDHLYIYLKGEISGPGKTQ